MPVNLSLPQFRYDLKRLHIAFLNFQIEFPHLISFQVRGWKCRRHFSQEQRLAPRWVLTVVLHAVVEQSHCCKTSCKTPPNLDAVLLTSEQPCRNLANLTTLTGTWFRLQIKKCNIQIQCRWGNLKYYPVLCMVIWGKMGPLPSLLELRSSQMFSM